MIRQLGLLVVCAAGSATVPACTRQGTQLVVVVDSDFTVPDELRFVNVETFDDRGARVSTLEYRVDRPDRVAPGGAVFSLPLSFAVLPRPSRGEAPVRVDVTGLDASHGFLAATRAVTRFVAGRALVLPMYLAVDCRSIRCDDPMRTCNPRTRMCDTAVVPESTLAQFDGGGTELRRDGAMPGDAFDAADATDAVDAADVFDARDATDVSTTGDADVFDAFDVGTDGDAADGTMGTDAPDAAVVGSFRLLAPLSGSFALTRRPTLRWNLGSGVDGARVEVCATAACTGSPMRYTVTGASGAPPTDVAGSRVYWRAEALAGGMPTGRFTHTWLLHVSPRATPVDRSFGTLSDFNGDGHAELVVGAPFIAATMPYVPGGIYVLRGGASGLPSSLGPYIRGRLLDQLFGAAIASVGDTDGDGFDDLLVGAHQGNPSAGGALSGGALLYYGGSSGVAAGTRAEILDGTMPRMHVGYSVSGVGDINLDGFDDIAVGAIGFSPPGRGNAGAVFVYHGSASRPPAMMMPTATTTLLGTAADESFGTSLTHRLDYNGDGFADLAVGVVPSTAAPAFVRVFAGGAAGLNPMPTQTLMPAMPDGQFGASIAAAGDVDGDGYGDMVVGSATGGCGATSMCGYATLYFGSPTGFDMPGVRFATGTGSDRVGWRVAGGDLDGDGLADLVVGAPGAGAGGEVHVYRGSASRTAPSRLVVLRGTLPSEQFGADVTLCADVTGDGRADIAVGASSAAAVGAAWGRVYVFAGQSAPPFVNATAVGVFDGEAEGHRFGTTVAARPSAGRTHTPADSRSAAGHTS